MPTISYPQPRLRLRAGAALLLLLLAVLLPASPAVAEDETPAAGVPGAKELTVAVIRGQQVNLRVGPRVDVRPVLRLDEGAVLLIVERVPGWVGVRLPEGFPAAVSGRYVTAVGVDAVRVTGRKLNMRVEVPTQGKGMPGAFRDHPDFGAVLPMIERRRDWVVVLAPESIRAYVSERYVHELGPLSEHRALVDAARARRTQRVRSMAEARREAAAQASGLRLREAIGAAQQRLYRLRLERGIDRTPVVVVVNTLEQAMEAGRAAPLGVRKLARAIRADLEAELEMRTARKDAEVARLRGLAPQPERTPAPRIEHIVVRGTIRWEPAPRWRNGGAFVLWVGEDPTHVLRLTTGLPRPLPDLKGCVGKGARTVEGSQPGDRVFGLPVIEVHSLKE